MKILLVNQPLGNRGDEAAHRALVKTMLSTLPDSQIRVLFLDSNEVWSINSFNVKDERVKYVNLHSFFGFGKNSIHSFLDKRKLYPWRIHPFARHIFAQYDWADVVVCAPGGICMGGFQNWEHLFFLKVAEYCKKPLAYYGRSFGPFPTETQQNRQFKDISLEMLHYFSYLSIRDGETERLADELGISYVSSIDSAFLEKPCVEIPYEVKHAIGDGHYMVFVPNYLLWHYVYDGKISEDDLIDLYCRMIEEFWKFNPGLSIVMLPQVFGKGGKVDDLPFFREIAGRLNDKRVVVIPDCYSSDIQQTIIGGSDFVVGARYHSIVFAINQNVPFIALSYEHKITGLLEKLEKTDCMMDFSKAVFSEEGRNSCIEEIRRMLPLLQPDSNAQLKAVSIAKNGWDEFVRFLSAKED